MASIAPRTGVEFKYHDKTFFGTLMSVSENVCTIKVPFAQKMVKVHMEMILRPVSFHMPSTLEGANIDNYLHSVTIFQEKTYVIVGTIGSYFILLHKSFHQYIITKTSGAIIYNPNMLSSVDTCLGVLKISLDQLGTRNRDDIEKYIEIARTTNDDYPIISILPKALHRDIKSGQYSRPTHGSLQLLSQTAADVNLPIEELNAILGMNDHAKLWTMAEHLMIHQSYQRMFRCEYTLDDEYINVTVHWKMPFHGKR